MSQLYIPKKLKVGYVKRNDTYDGRLAYVVYYDNKGKIPKQRSFDNWVNKEIPTVEFDNTPFNGFVLNKSITRYAWDHFGNTTTKIRIYDSRGAEFEITAENLLGILTQVDCIKRDLAGEMVYAWSGKELVLLPCNSDEYKQALAFTEARNHHLTSKQLVPGRVYINRDNNKVVYLGKLSIAINDSYYRYDRDKPQLGFSREKRFLFVPLAFADEGSLKLVEHRRELNKYVSSEVSEDIHPMFASLLLQHLDNKNNSQGIKQFVSKPLDMDFIRDRFKNKQVVFVTPTRTQHNGLHNIFKLVPIQSDSSSDPVFFKYEIFHYDPSLISVWTRQLNLFNFFESTYFNEQTRVWERGLPRIKPNKGLGALHCFKENCIPSSIETVQLLTPELQAQQSCNFSLQIGQLSDLENRFDFVEVMFDDSTTMELKDIL